MFFNCVIYTLFVPLLTALLRDQLSALQYE
jgi:hypothetical protein